MKNLLIIGATSAIAQAVSRRYARNGDRFFLVARNADKLRLIADDLELRGASGVGFALLDLNDRASQSGVVQQAFSELGQIDIVLVAHGSLPDQETCETDISVLLDEVNTNALSTIALLTDIANRLQQQRNATLAVITSVAGERGRQSNYVYGSAKAMVSTFLQGLRNRFSRARCAVNVLDIRPGFVDTPMTAEFDKGLLWAQPETVARDIEKAIARGRMLVYTPFFWRFIMLVIRSIPESVFRRLGL